MGRCQRLCKQMSIVTRQGLMAPRRPPWCYAILGNQVLTANKTGPHGTQVPLGYCLGKWNSVSIVSMESDGSKCPLWHSRASWEPRRPLWCNAISRSQMPTANTTGPPWSYLDFALANRIQCPLWRSTGSWTTGEQSDTVESWGIKMVSTQIFLGVTLAKTKIFFCIQCPGLFNFGKSTNLKT